MGEINIRLNFKKSSVGDIISLCVCSSSNNASYIKSSVMNALPVDSGYLLDDIV